LEEEEEETANYVALHNAIFDKSDYLRPVTMTMGITRNERIRWLVEDKILGELKPYHELDNSGNKIVHDHIPLLQGYKGDGGGDYNNSRLQNHLAYFGGQICSGADKTFVYRGCPGYLYLFTFKRAMALINIALANLAFSIDSDAPRFL